MKTKIMVLLTFITIQLFMTGQSDAQVWQQTGGPQGGVTMDMLIVYQMYVGTILGIYATTLNGGNWTWMGGIEEYINTLLSAGQNLYAGSSGYGVEKSTNGGISWNPTGLTSGTILNLSSPGGMKIYAAIQGQGIEATTNGGQSWISYNNGLTNLNVSSMLWSTVSMGRGFVSTIGSGVYTTTDYGANWWAVNNGLTQQDVTNLILYESNLDELIIAPSILGFVGISTNNGQSWNEEEIPEIHGDAISGEVFPNELMDGTASTQKTILIGSRGDGIFMTSNNGVNWAPLNNGLSNRVVNRIKMDTVNHVLYACTNGGVFKSTNYGALWTEINNNLILTNVSSYLFTGGKIFASTAESGVYLSTDEGNSWAVLNSGLTDFNIHTLFSSGNNIYAGSQSGGVFITSNNGTSWTASNTGLLNKNVSSFASIGTNLFAGVNDYGSGGVYLSTNSGASWAAMNNGLTRKEVQCLISSGSNLFAGTFAGGVFKSSNSGASWTAVNNGLPSTPAVYCFMTNGNYLYAGTENGVYYTSNNGSTWTAANTGQSGVFINSIISSGNIIIAGSFGSGIMISSNNGSSWISVNSGLPYNYISALGKDNSYIFAGCYASGTWRTTVAQLIGVKEINNSVPENFELEQNYPNPFNPVTHIRFKVPESGFVTLKIFDMLGHEITTLVSEKLKPGTYETEFNGNNLASGVYFYQLHSEKYNDVKKMILVK